jgi:hypothetical protein
MRSVVQRFGGADLVAAAFGMFTALGVLVFLGALVAAGAGGIDYQLNAIDLDGNLQDVEVVGAAVAALVVFVSFLVGGWATGRMARYDGAVNGLGAALLFVALVAAFAAAGAWAGSEYNAFAAADLPNWFAQFDAQDVTAGAIGAAAAGVVAALAGGLVGGWIGATYHQKADAALVQQTLA